MSRANIHKDSGFRCVPKDEQWTGGLGSNVKKKKKKEILDTRDHPHLHKFVPAGPAAVKNGIRGIDLMEVNKTISGKSNIFHHRSPLMEQPQ